MYNVPEEPTVSSMPGVRPLPYYDPADEQSHPSLAVLSPGRVLPDVARDVAASVAGRLDRVGMAGIEVGLQRRDARGRLIVVPARADAFVSLDDPEAKGIHMSRLFLALQTGFDEEEFSLALAESLLERFVDSHAELSRSASLRVAFEHLERRESLLSDHSAWRVYPVVAESVGTPDGVRHWLEVRVTYSSACPCSAALSRQLLQEKFQREFAGHEWVSVGSVSHWLLSREATVAVPHSQRSHADVRIELAPEQRDLPITELVDVIEAALGTPVQAAVKRADEQEFARLNGDNLMFCEDAARRIRAALDDVPAALDYRIKVSHLESLHPHDATAIVVKGVPGGLTP